MKEYLRLDIISQWYRDVLYYFSKIIAGWWNNLELGIKTSVEKLSSSCVNNQSIRDRRRDIPEQQIKANFLSMWWVHGWHTDHVVERGRFSGLLFNIGVLRLLAIWLIFESGTKLCSTSYDSHKLFFIRFERTVCCNCFIDHETKRYLRCWSSADVDDNS